jgi:hypothetical protein
MKTVPKAQVAVNACLNVHFNTSEGFNASALPWFLLVAGHVLAADIEKGANSN